jgi:Protein kinase domain/Secretin and TonB N terminus short domain
VSDDDVVKVLDFGLAKPLAPVSFRTAEGHVLGTPRYMAPEQVEGQPLDHRSDLFSLGSIAYEVAAGRHPFEGASSIDVMHRIVHQPQRPLDDPELDRITARCLQKSPAQRYSSATELAADLRAYLQSPATERRPGRRRGRWVAAVVLAVAIAGGAAFVMSRGAPVVPATPRTATQPAPAPGSDGVWSDASPKDRARNLALLASPRYVNGERQYGGEILKMSIRNADLIDVLPLISAVSGVDILVDPGVGGTVTVHSENTPWDELFDRILAQNGLTYRVERGMVIVSRK